MAIFKSTLLGEVYKSAGNVTMCNIRGQNVAKAKIFIRKKSATPEMLKQRSRFTLLSKLSSVFLAVSRKGFPEKRGAQACNRFISLNHARVREDEDGVCMIAPEDIRCAMGRVRPSKVSVRYDRSGEAFVFTQTAEGVDGKYCRPDDRAYGALYESVLGRCHLIRLEERGEGGEVICPLPEDWCAERVHIWSFAVNRNQNEASDSCYLKI